MLLLARKPGERIIIGNDVTVTILNVKGNQVRVGIDAPITIPVHRQEIHQRIQAERQLNSTNTDNTATNTTDTE